MEKPRENLVEPADLFAVPELHTTLKVANALEKLQKQEFDSRKAALNKLKSSPKTKKNFTEKATKPVNIGFKRVVYQPNVQIDCDEEKLLLNAAKVKEAKIKASKIPPKIKDPLPDLMEFFTDDLQKEYVSLLPRTEPSSPSEKLDCKAPYECAFTLHRHKSSWDSSNFRNITD